MATAARGNQQVANNRRQRTLGKQGWETQERQGTQFILGSDSETFRAFGDTNTCAIGSPPLGFQTGFLGRWLNLASLSWGGYELGVWEFLLCPAWQPTGRKLGLQEKE